MKLKSVNSVGFVALAAVALGACGSSGGTGAPSGSTIKTVNSAAFVTSPPIITSPETTTTIAGGVVTLDGEQIYVVRGGDYLFSIAKLYGVSADEIATYNQWAEGIDHPLYAGDEVRIPPGATAVDQTTLTTPPTVAPSTEVTTAAETTTTVDTSGGGTYIVADGDVLSLIASRNGTTVEAIVAANGWTDGDKHLIYEGLKIKLPAKTG